MLNRVVVKDAAKVLLGFNISDKDADNFLEKYPSLAKGGFLARETFYMFWKFVLMPKLKLAFETDEKDLYVRNEAGEFEPVKK